MFSDNKESIYGRPAADLQMYCIAYNVQAAPPTPNTRVRPSPG
jgi:hypothetical protein